MMTECKVYDKVIKKYSSGPQDLYIVFIMCNYTILSLATNPFVYCNYSSTNFGHRVVQNISSVTGPP